MQGKTMTRASPDPASRNVSTGTLGDRSHRLALNGPAHLLVAGEPPGPRHQFTDRAPSKGGDRKDSRPGKG